MSLRDLWRRAPGRWHKRWVWIIFACLPVATFLQPIVPGASIALWFLLGIAIGFATIAGSRDERYRRLSADSAGFSFGLAIGATIVYDIGQGAWAWPDLDARAVMYGLGAIGFIGCLITWVVSARHGTRQS